jgi:glycosyltransferase involved in cell wall biosynthesis
MTGPGSVSVVICTWNRCESLRRTLQSFLRLRIPDDLKWELLVVNNNSTDATNDVVRAFEGSLPIRLLQQPRTGKCAAANLATAEANGDVLLWTDDDVVVDPSWIERIVSGFRAFEADFVFGPSRPLWHDGIAPDWFSPRHNGTFALIDYGAAPFIVQDLSTPFFGVNFAVRRELLISLGGFREDIGIKEASGGWEDMDLFRRAWAGGHRIVYVPNAIVEHVIAPARMTRAFHRNKMKAGLPMYYRSLQDQYTVQPWLFGVPRFLFRKLLADSAGYARSVLARDRASAFHYELQILKFVGVCRQGAARRALRAAGKPATAQGRQA